MRTPVTPLFKLLTPLTSLSALVSKRSLFPKTQASDYSLPVFVPVSDFQVKYSLRVCSLVSVFHSSSVCSPVHVFETAFLLSLTSERCVLDFKLLSVVLFRSSERLFPFLCVPSGPLPVISFCVVPVYSPVPPVLAASNKLCQRMTLCRLKSLTESVP